MTRERVEGAVERLVGHGIVGMAATRQDEGPVLVPEAVEELLQEQRLADPRFPLHVEADDAIVGRREGGGETRRAASGSPVTYTWATDAPSLSCSESSRLGSAAEPAPIAT